MEFITITLLCILCVAANATHVQITERWKPDQGWEVTCAWTLLRNDSLQSVRLFNNDMQFMVYRPENSGQSLSHTYSTPEMSLQVDCTETDSSGVRGKCIFIIGPYEPPTNNIKVGCEASGERPHFRIERQDHVLQPIVTPIDAVLQTTLTRTTPIREILNCSSAGLPEPKFIWTIGGQKHQLPTKGKVWNTTSKLWHAWSSYVPDAGQPGKIVCTPETQLEDRLLQGKPAEYNCASRYLGITSIISSMLVLVTLLR